MAEDRSKGQHLYVSRGLYTHHGLGDGKGCVIHYSGLADEVRSGPICRASLDEFSKGQEISVKIYKERCYSLDEAVSRAASRLGEDGYSIWGNNCEHFVEWCVDGNHSSKQVDRSLALASGLLTQGAARGTVAVVASQGTVAGLSASGIMTGLATTGGIVGGGAVAGLGVLGGTGGLGMAQVMNNTVLKDDPILPSEEREARSVGRKATYTGATAATASGVVAVSATGATAGLSAAGISSGLAAIGGAVGGGMAAGTMIVVAAPVAAAAVAGYGTYKLWKWLKS